MQHTKKSKKKLEDRMKTLKQRFGCDVNKYPARFFTPLPTLKKPRRMNKQKDKNLAQNNKPEHPILLEFAAQQIHDQLKAGVHPDEAVRIVQGMFEHVPRSIVRQDESPDSNVGEVTTTGARTLLEAAEPISETDVFLDVGSGLSNIIAQAELFRRSTHLFISPV